MTHHSYKKESAVFIIKDFEYYEYGYGTGKIIKVINPGAGDIYCVGGTFRFPFDEVHLLKDPSELLKEIL